MQYLIRFVVGGLAVSLFALTGDVLHPKRFAGLFGAAPSIALATLALTVRTEGPTYAATEARSMIIGAAALLIYAAVVARVLWTRRLGVAKVTIAGIGLWLAIAVTGWVLLRSLP